MSRYPCEPVPFGTMFGDVMMCGKCGHGPAPKECRDETSPAELPDNLPKPGRDGSAGE